MQAKKLFVYIWSGKFSFASHAFRQVALGRILPQIFPHHSIVKNDHPSLFFDDIPAYKEKKAVHQRTIPLADGLHSLSYP